MENVRSEIQTRYRLNVEANAPILVTAEAAKLLRGLLGISLQAMADRASVKRKQLGRFENGRHLLSPRDRRWLQASFEQAGAEFFLGQGQLHVRLNGQKVIDFGTRSTELQDLPLGETCRAQRYVRRGGADGGLSQKNLSRASGVPQHRISAIENLRRKKFSLADQVNLKHTFANIPEDPDRRARYELFVSRGWGMYL